MSMDRRTVLKTAAALAASVAVPRRANAGTVFTPTPGPWRSFETVVRVKVAKPVGKVQAWIPLPSVDQSIWMRSGESTWTTDTGTATVAADATYGAKMLHVVWPDGAAPAIEVTSRFQTRDRSIDLSAPGGSAPLSDAEHTLYTKSTAFIPVDGLVKEAADKITAGATTDLDKARAIYEWVVDNTARNPKTRGCGLGDITYLLKSGDLSGKCADLNALFVGLARASGLAARDVYGLRLSPSKFGYRSLGPSTANVTKAQHCRAEVFLTGLGWIPVDPADVRKVVLEEPPGNITLADERVVAARKTLLGAWEGNWLAYNFAHDVVLPGSAAGTVPFLMYPQVETASGRLDSLDPDSVSYEINAREISG